VPQGDGEYFGVFHPTALGDYTFRVGGEIAGTPVEIEETSSPTTFNAVEPLAAVQFPYELPSAVDLATQVAALAARVEALERELAGESMSP
jgi:hypothetical protein